MNIKSKATTAVLVVLCGASSAFAQTTNNDPGVSDRDQRQPGSIPDSNNSTNSIADPSGIVINGTKNNGADDRDNRQNTATRPGQMQTQTATGDYSVNDPQFRFGRLDKASMIINREVIDSQGQKLGKVKDLAIDLQHGRIVEVIVARGGFLGVEEKCVAVTPSQLAWDAANKTLQFNAGMTLFDSAPVVKLSSWTSSMDQAEVAKVYQYYGTTAYFAATNYKNDNLTDTNSWNQLGEVQRASKVIGLTTVNLQNEKVGKVENLIVDLQAGRVVEVVLASGGFLGMGGEISTVPPQSFGNGIHSDTLTLDRNRADLSSAPHFKTGDWNQMTNRDQVETVYRSYRVPAYFDTNRADNTAQNVRDRAGDSLTPLDQGTSPADIDTTRQIRKQIVAASNLSVNAHNVKIITVDGKVTLRGPVNSEEEKREIGDIAARVATASNVRNELQVRNASTTSSVN